MAQPNPTLKLVVLSGRSGSGKSSTAYEICHILRREKVPHVHIDGDNLDAFYPRDDTSELMLLNLQAMWKVYYPYVREIWKQNGNSKPFIIVFSGTGMVLELKAVTNIFGAVLRESLSTQHEKIHVNLEVKPVVLQASSDIVERRLSTREIGGELEAHLESSDRTSHILAALDSDQISTFTTDSVSVTDVALAILRTIGVEVT